MAFIADDTPVRGKTSSTSGDTAGLEPDAVDDIVEKALLLGTPDDRIKVAISNTGLVRSERAARLQSIRRLWKAEPGLLKELTPVIASAWDQAGKETKGPTERRRRFFEAIAEQRAKVLTRLQLEHLHDSVPKAIQLLYQELPKYLQSPTYVSPQGSAKSPASIDTDDLRRRESLSREPAAIDWDSGRYPEGWPPKGWPPTERGLDEEL